MNNKKGITLLSIVVYVVLFFTFTVFVSLIVTNLNIKTIQSRADIILNEQFLKLQQNIFVSSKNSNSFDKISEKIVFSNNDEYKFDKDKKQILKNGGLLISGVEEFSFVNLTDVEKNKYSNNINNVIKLNVIMKKYEKVFTQEIFMLVGDEYGV